MNGILVVCETGPDGLHKMSLETLVAGQKLGAASGQSVSAVVFGTVPLPSRVDKVYRMQHELLSAYTADGYTAALEALLRKVDPAVVLFPHTYQVRDFAPKLATRFDETLISDVVGVREGTFQRQLFQGRLNADFTPAPGHRVFASVQAGAFRADQLETGEAPEEIFVPLLDAGAVRQKPEAPFRESARAVDLSGADVIVSVGRGIKEQENLPIVQELAQALGAELAASRPICDNGWLPMERQVGSSGQTVAPKVYLAVGISGAIQHLVGMKASKTIVAINKDPNAPIFEVADYGIIGDLFEVVPALVSEVKKARG